MAVQHWYSSTGSNYRNGSYNDGSHMVGWDNNYIRAEVFSFTTGSWPVSHLKWWGPGTSLYQGSNIAIRYGISTSPTTYVSSSGPNVGYALNKNDYNEVDVNLSPNTTYYITFFPGVDRGTGWGLLNIGTDYPGDWFSIYATEVDYTACSAPTSISLNKSIQTPGQNATLSWAGAKAGINLSIGSYEVYRSTSSSGTYSLLGTTTNTYYNVAAPSAGSYYYYKVITVPSSHTEYKSGFSSASSGLKGNTAPGAPTVSFNKNKVPSTGGQITFTVRAGSDSDGQTLSLAYSLSSSGTKSSFTSPLTLSFTSNSTVYFYTYDGLAYSSAASASITVNTKPVITNVTFDTITKYNALGGDGETNKQLGYAYAIKPKISANKTGVVTVGVEYYSSNDTGTWSRGEDYSYKTMQEVSISSQTGVVLSNYNLHQYLPFSPFNLHWRVYFRINDGIENSDWVYFPAESSGEYYSIARSSPLIASYNQFSNSNIVGTNAGEIWRNVRLKLYNDTSVPYISASAKMGNTPLIVSNTTQSFSEDEMYRYVDITLQDEIPGDSSILITAQATDGNRYFTKTTNTTVKETKIPTLGNLSHGAKTIKPFTSTGDFTVSTAWPFGSYTALNAATLAAYNCNTTAANVIKLVHSSSSDGSGDNRVIKSLTWTKESDSLRASMQRETAYGWDYSLGVQSYSGSYNYYCRIEITNLFGKVISTPWLSRIFSFVETAQSPTITSIDWSLDKTDWQPLGSDAIQEGVYLRFGCSFGLYTTDAVTISVLLTNSSGERSVGCYEQGSIDKITPITYLDTELSRAEDRDVAQNTKYYIYQITNEIADTTDRKWRLGITNTGGTIYSSYKTTSVTRQCAPTLILTSCEADASYRLTYSYTLTDNGGGTLENYLSDGTNNFSNKLINSSGTVQSLVTDWETATICIKTVSTVTGLYTHTKTYYSNSILVYQVSPTVAYRQNQIGINTDSPGSAAIVDIHQTTGKQTVLIQGLDANAVPTKFEINVATGQINFYSNNSLQYSINLSKGILT